MRASVAALVIVLGFETTSASAAPADTRAPTAGSTVALLPLVGSGLGADELARAERTIRREVDARYGKRSLKEQVVRARLDEGSAAGLRCDRAQVACLVQLGIVCQVDAVLVASIAPGATAESTKVSLRLVDVLEGQQVAFASVVVAASPLPEEVSALLASLASPPARALGVRVEGPAGAAVFVDGHAAGTLPFVSPIMVTAGEHEVRVETTPQPHVERVDVRPGELVVVNAPLPAMTEPAPALVEPAPASAQPLAAPDAATAAVQPFPIVPTLAGAATIAVGAVALAFGVAPLVGYEGHAARLEELDAEIGDDPIAVAERAAEVKAERDALEADEAAWNSYGAIVAVSGGALVVVGAGAIVGALLFSE